MKTHFIVQTLGIGLFLMSSFTVALPVIDAGGPPVRLTLGQTPIRINEEEDDQTSPPTQLLPTQWESPIQLIPTDIEFETVVTKSDDPALQETGNLHSRCQSTYRAEIGSLVSFLDSHLARGSVPAKTD